MYEHEHHYETTPAEGTAPLWAWVAFWVSFLAILGFCL